jgi:hypothetical protein
MIFGEKFISAKVESAKMEITRLTAHKENTSDNVHMKSEVQKSEYSL